MVMSLVGSCVRWPRPGQDAAMHRPRRREPALAPGAGGALRRRPEPGSGHPSRRAGPVPVSLAPTTLAGLLRGLLRRLPRDLLRRLAGDLPGGLARDFLGRFSGRFL